MKKLRTRKAMILLFVVPGVVGSVLLAFALWGIVQFNVMIAVAIAAGLSAVITLAGYLISDKGISFDEEQFVVKGDRAYNYYEIDEVAVKYSDIDYRRYKAIIVDGKEVCYFDDLYQNAKEFIAILEKHGFTVESDNRMMN